MRSQRRLIAVCSGALFLPLLFPLVTGRVFTRDDMAALHLPFRYLYREALRAGDRFVDAGAPLGLLSARGRRSGMAHPLHLLLYRLLPLGVAFNLEIVSNSHRDAGWHGPLLCGSGCAARRRGLVRWSSRSADSICST
jgi:hypothetical protein